MYKVAKKIDVKPYPFSKKMYNIKFLFKNEISSKVKQKSWHVDLLYQEFEPKKVSLPKFLTR